MHALVRGSPQAGEPLPQGDDRTVALTWKNLREVTVNYYLMDPEFLFSVNPFAVSKAYVKVYARLRGGKVRFFKDGYTDLRGKFDYASLNSSDSPNPPPVPLENTRADARGSSGNLGFQMLRPEELPQDERLSILVLSDTHGALVREVSPPKQ